jgi:hypothetical protein
MNREYNRISGLRSKLMDVKMENNVFGRKSNRRYSRWI